MDSPALNPPGRFVPTLTAGPLWDQLCAGMSRSAFARKTGVTRESIARWAKGGRARRGSVAQIALATSRTPAEIEGLLQLIAEASKAPPAETAEAAP